MNLIHYLNIEHDELQIRELVKDILSGRIQNEEDDLDQLLNIVIADDSRSKTSGFILRSPTGRQTEEFYLKYYTENKKPIDGKLIDCRDPSVSFLQNPAKKLNPKRKITTSIQINWSISEKQLAELND